MNQKALTARTIVGLEVHVQLRTRSKMFCGCAVRYDAEPNSCVCPVCLGHPGTLPVINREAIRQAVLTGLALNCRIAPFTKWDRKSYYYPDLPKNYQISQYDLPIAEAGSFTIDVDGREKSVRIKRAHLEEDAGKNIHDSPGCTLVDLNRAGTPLLEIVTEPDLASGDEAYAFCTGLQQLVTYLGVSDANMQLGQMRFEPNVNVVIEHDGGVVRTPIAEIKNLNSFRSVRNAIDYESARQIAEWQKDPGFRLGQRPNENRGWNDDRGITEYQRAKEAAHDYRYFPDPDLVPVQLGAAVLDEWRQSLPELPRARRLRFVANFGLSAKDAETIAQDRATAELYEQVVVAGGPPGTAAKQLVNVWLKLANDRGVPVTQLGVEAGRMAELAGITESGTVSKTAANQVAEGLVDRPEGARALAETLGLIQVQDTDATAAWVDEALQTNEKAVQDALANPKKAKAAAGFLRGQVMRISGGKADPKLVGRLIEQRLSEMRPP